MTKLEQIKDYAKRADLVDSAAVMWLVNRCEKLEAVRGAALLVTHERKLVWYRKLEEALAAAEDKG